ncbi:DUF2272 domain-containing protein [Rhodoplanes sp. Z2-YC6860]|uniref:DUF2272 domain-containing protein n=1 Tax=Rhodoplanes sp. Z2-YC6860 TaxID=674703 RepID=UPI00078D6F44|nr:DUF2272 domain-containing protein [Rhodoplanes sp. Z2-YC6860]AMN40111.1 hypothetical protein RHPLAN_16560 [Rhodoplanes sp. Z2-YC6860]
MRTTIVPALLAIALSVAPASAQPQASPRFWPSVQKICDQTAATKPSSLAKKIAQTALDEHYRFGGHQIDSDGRLFRFGLVESEQEEEASGPQATLGHLGWWQVLKYWRALYGTNPKVAARLRVWGYEEASASHNEDRDGAPDKDRAPLHDEATKADLTKVSVADLIRLGAQTNDRDAIEVLREAAFRSAIVDNPWSAAFVSYVVKTAALGGGPNPSEIQSFARSRFPFSAAHRDYILAAFKTSLADAPAGKASGKDGHLYRACPVYATEPRIGDMLCYHRERQLKDASDSTVRNIILDDAQAGRFETSISHNHCDVVVHVDREARKVYVVGGNVQQSVTVKKLRLRRDMKLAENKSGCGDWTLPPPSASVPVGPSVRDNCSLNEKKWFVLLQMR